MAKKVKKRGSIFWKIFAVWLVILGAVCIAALVYGRKVMFDYDNAQKFPYEESVRIAKKIEGGDYSMLYSLEKLPNSMTIEKDEYERRIAEAVSKNGGCDVAKGFSPDSIQNPTFIISAGSKKIATVVFQKLDQKSEYGFDLYEFKSITPFTEGFYGVRLLVPEDCDFILNGDPIGEDYRTGETVVRKTETDDFELSADVTCYYYYVDALMKEPTFRIVYKDTGRDADMIWDGELEVWTTRKYETAATAPSNYKVFVNGVEISQGSRFVKEANIAVDEISYAQQYTEKKLTTVSYHVSGLRYKDDVEVLFEDFEGRRLAPEYSEKRGEYVCETGIQPADKTVYGIDDEFLCTRAVDYARFVNADAKFGNSIGKYLLKDSQVFNDLKDFWVVFTPHDSYWIENKTVEELIFYHEDLFRATVSFDYWIRGYNHQTDNEKVYPTTVTFWYARIGGTWYIVDWELGEGESD